MRLGARWVRGRVRSGSGGRLVEILGVKLGVKLGIRVWERGCM